MANTENKIVNFYDRRALLDMAQELKRPTTFLTKTFFSRIEEFATASVDLDIRKGKRRAAAYVRRRAEGNLYEKQAFETNTFTPPYLKPKVVITPSDLRKRIPGESLFVNGGQELSTLAQDFIAEQIADIDEQIIIAAIEVQAKQALFDGVVTCYDEKGQVLATVNFDRHADLTYTEQAGDLWSAGTANIAESGRRASRLIRKHSGFGTQMAIMGADAAAKFFTDANLQKALSKDWSARGGLAYDLRPNGGVWCGYADGIDYWTYDEWYVDPSDGVEKQLIPAKKVLYAAANAPASQVFGALELVDQSMGARAIQTYTIDDPQAAVFQIHSAPLCVTKHPNAYAVVTVLT